MNTTGEARYYKKDCWSIENQKFAVLHHRLQKAARLANQIAGGRPSTLLDVGCGPATLAQLLQPNIEYFGIDIAIQQPRPNLVEADILETPIGFAGREFDIVLAQGLFEYLGDHQSEKFDEIARILRPSGTFIVSYVNFGHRTPEIYRLYSNVQSFEEFSTSLGRHFTITRCLPTSLNWNHSEPNRKWLSAINMHLNANVPFVTRRLAVEYFFICSPLPPHDRDAPTAPPSPLGV